MHSVGTALLYAHTILTPTRNHTLYEHAKKKDKIITHKHTRILYCNNLFE